MTPFYCNQPLEYLAINQGSCRRAGHRVVQRDGAGPAAARLDKALPADVLRRLRRRRVLERRRRAAQRAPQTDVNDKGVERRDRRARAPRSSASAAVPVCRWRQLASMLLSWL